MQPLRMWKIKFDLPLSMTEFIKTMYLCFAKRFSKRRISLASGFYDVRTIIIFSYCFKKQKLVYQGFPGGDSGKEPVCQCRRCRRCGFDPWIGKLPWRRRWQPSPVFLSEKSHGRRSLAGYSPQGRKSQTWLSVRASWFVTKKARVFRGNSLEETKTHILH